MSKGKGRVHSRYGRFAKLPYRVFAIGVDDPRRRNQVCVAFIDEDGVEDINQGFINKEGFEEQGDDGGPFAENQESSIKPRKVAVKDC